MKTVPAAVPYDIQPLIARVHSYAQLHGLKPTYASKLVFGDGERLSLIEDQGKTLTLKTAVKAWRKLDQLEEDFRRSKLRQAESAA